MNTKNKNLVQAEVKAAHDRLGERLFGSRNRECLNLRSNLTESNFVRGAFWDKIKNPNNGVIGELYDEVYHLKEQIADLHLEIAKLQKPVKKKTIKKVVKKTPAKKKVTKKKVTVKKKATKKRK